jgi:hypothetical protein
MGASGKFEVVLGTLLTYVNSQNRRELFRYKSESDGKAHDPRF